MGAKKTQPTKLPWPQAAPKYVPRGEDTVCTAVDPDVGALARFAFDEARRRGVVPEDYEFPDFVAYVIRDWSLTFVGDTLTHLRLRQQPRPVE